MSAPREVAPGIHVSTSRKYLTNATILAGDGEAFLVDPGWMPDELEVLASWLGSHELTVTGGFATHAHHDHLLWHPGFGDAPRWASARTAELAQDEREGLLEALGPDFPPELAELMGRVSAWDGTSMDAAGFDLELIVHDGHAPGHTALWLPRERVLLAGDMLSDVELPLPFWPDDVLAYLAALDLLAPYASQARFVVPGHGHAGTDATARLDADRRYVGDVMRTGESDDPRLANPGMAEMHEHLVEIARGESAPPHDA